MGLNWKEAKANATFCKYTEGQIGTLKVWGLIQEVVSVKSKVWGQFEIIQTFMGQMENILKSTIRENDAFSSPNLRLIPTMVMAESMKDSWEGLDEKSRGGWLRLNDDGILSWWFRGERGESVTAEEQSRTKSTTEGQTKPGKRWLGFVY